MKKIITSILALAIVLTIIVCASKEKMEKYEQVEYDGKSLSILERNVSNIADLVFDNESYIIYYLVKGDMFERSAYLSRYYSDNGNLCRYNVEKKQIEEIIE